MRTTLFHMGNKYVCQFNKTDESKAKREKEVRLLANTSFRIGTSMQESHGLNNRTTRKPIECWAFGVITSATSFADLLLNSVKYSQILAHALDIITNSLIMIWL